MRELIGIKIWVAVHQAASPHTGVTNFEDGMVSYLILKIHAPLLGVTDGVRPFRPNLTGALPNLRQSPEGASSRLEQAIGEGVADEIGWNIAGSVHATDPVRSRRKSKVLARLVEADHR